MQDDPSRPGRPKVGLCLVMIMLMMKKEEFLLMVSPFGGRWVGAERSNPVSDARLTLSSPQVNTPLSDQMIHRERLRNIFEK